MFNGVKIVVFNVEIFVFLCVFLYWFKNVKCWNVFILILLLFNVLFGKL